MSTGSPKTTVIQLNFDGGMDQRTHPRQVQSPMVLRATNARYPRVGAAEKRNGIVSITSQFYPGIPMNVGQGKLLAHRDELLVIDGYLAGSVDVGTGSTRAIAKSLVPEAVSTARAVDSSQYGVMQPSVAIGGNGVEYYAWISDDSGAGTGGPAAGSFVYSTVQDTFTGAELMSSVVVDTGANAHPRIIAQGSAAIMFFARSNAAQIYFCTWDPATLQWSAATQLVNDGFIQPAPLDWQQYEVCKDDLGTSIYLVYQQGNNNVRVLKLDYTGAILASIVSTENLLPTAALGFGICANAGERVWVSYSRNNSPVTAASTLRASAYSPTLGAQTTAPFSIPYGGVTFSYAYTSICRVTSTTAVLMAYVSESIIAGPTISGTADRVVYPIVSSTGVVVGNATGVNRQTFWAIPASDPFVASTNPLRCYAWMMVGGASLGTMPKLPPIQSQQWTMMLVDLNVSNTTLAYYVARPITWQSPLYSLPDYLPMVDNITLGGSAAATYAGSNMFGWSKTCKDPSANEWLTTNIIRLNNNTRVGLQKTRAIFDHAGRFSGASLGPSLIMTPGFYWDRKRFSEVSFAYWPQNITATVGAAGGGLKNGEIYAYRALYEYVDGTGAVHRSKPSETLFVTIPAGAGAAGMVTLTVPCLTVTCRQGLTANDELMGVRIVVYRSGPISTGDGSFNRVFSDSTSPKNKPLQSTITFDDKRAGFDPADAAPFGRIQRDTIYTAGGVKDNVMAAGFTACVTFRNRVFVAVGNQVFFSKTIVAGEAVAFTNEFSIPLEESGDITALFVMDDTLYICTPERIYGMQGDGPSDANTLTDFGTPSRVLTDRGCIDQRSVVVTPMGTIFQSRVGLQMLDRGRAVANEPLGLRAQNDLEAYPEITSALLHPTNGTVTFTLRNPVPSGSLYSGVRLVYDYMTDRWSRDVQLAGTATDFGNGALSEVVSRGIVWSYFAQPAGNQLCAETPGIYLEAGAWMTLEIVMSEIHPQGLQGHIGIKKWEQNIERFTDHNIVLTWYRDYSSTPIESRTITSDVIATAGPVEQFSQNLATHSAQSYRLTIKDDPPSGPGGVVGTGRGAAFIGLAVEVDPIDTQIYKLPAARKS